MEQPLSTLSSLINPLLQSEKERLHKVDSLLFVSPGFGTIVWQNRGLSITARFRPTRGMVDLTGAVSSLLFH